MKTILCGLVLGVIVAVGQAQLIPDCNGHNWQLFPDITNCANYYRCEQSIAVLHRCPNQLYYDDNLKTCNWPTNVECNIVVVEPPFEPLPPITNPSTCPPNEDPQIPTHLAHPFDCTKFYKCWYGTPYLMDCPWGQQWNDEKKYCDYPQNANCINRLPPL